MLHVVQDLVAGEILDPDRDPDAAFAQLFRDMLELLVGHGLHLRQAGRHAEIARFVVADGHGRCPFTVTSSLH